MARDFFKDQRTFLNNSLRVWLGIGASRSKVFKVDISAFAHVNVRLVSRTICKKPVSQSTSVVFRVISALFSSSVKLDSPS